MKKVVVGRRLLLLLLFERKKKERKTGGKTDTYQLRAASPTSNCAFLDNKPKKSTTQTTDRGAKTGETNFFGLEPGPGSPEGGGNVRD